MKHVRTVGLRWLLVAALIAAAALSGPLPGAHADGDPGSDVLVYQPLFLAADSGISVHQQVRLGALLQAAGRRHVPIRVAIIATRSDLGAVTALWRKPQAYARFLGIELSLAYHGRLLIVMPNGFGINWPGHSVAAAYRSLDRVPIGTGGSGLAAAAQAAIESLAASAGVNLSGSVPSSPHPSSPHPSSPHPSSPHPSSPHQSRLGRSRGGIATSVSGPRARHRVSGSSAGAIAAAVVVALLIAGLVVLALTRLRLSWRPRIRASLTHLLDRRLRVLLTAGFVVGIAAATVAVAAIGPPGPSQSDALVTNLNIDPGTPLHRQAPGFTLTDQFGRQVSLRAFRGRVVLLAFNDSECTTICPLTTVAMLDAKAMLGKAGKQVQLLGVDANPKATSLEDVLSYSELHGMLNQWHFLTGSLPALERVWKSYGVAAEIQAGLISHTPALYVIDRQGRERKLYLTQQSYAAVGQLGQLLAQQASALLPGHPRVNSHLSYAQIHGITPATTVSLPRAGGGTVRAGPGRARVYLFFATWDRQITGLAGGLEGLSRYNAAALRAGLPAVTALDESTVEPPGALRSFLSSLPHPLNYPVALDRSGRVADGYEVSGLPWLVVVSKSGRIAWYYSVSVLGWPSPSTLIEKVREALTRSTSAPAGLRKAQAELAGSPPPLAALHRQASQLLGSEPALAARIRALRGYPIVVNIWASWCDPCRAEFGLLAAAAARYGRQVAFLGADNSDSSGAARGFLAEHPVTYPSYQTTYSDITGILPAGIAGTPTTIFIDRHGKIASVHIGQYDAQGTLDGDIQTYALGG